MPHHSAKARAKAETETEATASAAGSPEVESLEAEVKSLKRKVDILEAANKRLKTSLAAVADVVAQAIAS